MCGRLLSEIVKKLKARLEPGDRLLRWKDGAFVLVLDRDASLGDIGPEVRSITDIGSEIYLDTGNQSIPMTVAFTSGFFDLARCESLGVLFRQVDQFIARSDHLGGRVRTTH